MSPHLLLSLLLWSKWSSSLNPFSRCLERENYLHSMCQHTKLIINATFSHLNCRHYPLRNNRPFPPQTKMDLHHSKELQSTSTVDLLRRIWKRDIFVARLPVGQVWSGPINSDQEEEEEEEVFKAQKCLSCHALHTSPFWDTLIF